MGLGKGRDENHKRKNNKSNQFDFLQRHYFLPLMFVIKNKMLVPRGVEALNSERHHLNNYYKVILQNEDLASFFHSSDYTIPFVKQSLN